MLDPRQIEAFAAVVRTGSTVAAAEALNLSQPSVSRLVAALERATGLALFLRSGGRLVLTEPGRLFHVEVERLHLGTAELAIRAREIRRAGEALVRIATIAAGAVHVVPRALALLDSPGLRPALTMRSHHRVLEMVAAGRAELGLANAVGAQDPVRALRRWRLPCAIVLPSKHRLAARREITVADLEGEALISLGDAFHAQAIDDPTVVAALRRLSRADANLGLPACRMVEAGLGVALVDPLTAAVETAGGRLLALPFRPAALYPLTLVVPLVRPMSAVAKALAERIAAGIEQVSPARPVQEDVQPRGPSAH